MILIDVMRIAYVSDNLFAIWSYMTSSKNFSTFFFSITNLWISFFCRCLRSCQCHLQEAPNFLWQDKKIPWPFKYNTFSVKRSGHIIKKWKWVLNKSTYCYFTLESDSKNWMCTVELCTNFCFWCHFSNQWSYFDKLLVLLKRYYRALYFHIDFCSGFERIYEEKWGWKKKQLFIKSSYNLNFYTVKKLNLCWSRKYIGLKKNYMYLLRHYTTHEGDWHNFVKTRLSKSKKIRGLWQNNIRYTR